MIEKMLIEIMKRTGRTCPLCAIGIRLAALLTAIILVGCGTSSTGPEGGSKRQATTGVSSSGYPAGEPKDAGSPALASSTESQYSRDQTEKDPSQGTESPNK
jgi:hypothetical protein